MANQVISNKLRHFESSLLFSQEPATDPYSERDESSALRSYSLRHFLLHLGLPTGTSQVRHQNPERTSLPLINIPRLNLRIFFFQCKGPHLQSI